MLLRRNEGQELVEYALVLPVLLLLVFGIVEFGRAVLAYNTIANAAREGARYGVVHPDETGGIEAAALSLTTGLDPTRVNVLVSGAANGQIEVEVTYDHPLIVGLIIAASGGGSTINLRSVASMQLEPLER